MLSIARVLKHFNNRNGVSPDTDPISSGVTRNSTLMSKYSPPSIAKGCRALYPFSAPFLGLLSLYHHQSLQSAGDCRRTYVMLPLMSVELFVAMCCMLFRLIVRCRPPSRL